MRVISSISTEHFSLKVKNRGKCSSRVNPKAALSITGVENIRVPPPRYNDLTLICDDLRAIPDALKMIPDALKMIPDVLKVIPDALKVISDDLPSAP
jgi:hypothetical protein